MPGPPKPTNAGSHASVEDEHGAPTAEIGDDARSRRSQQIAEHTTRQQPTDRDLSALDRNDLGNERKRYWENASSHDARRDARGHEDREIPGKRTGERGYRHDHQARKHGAGFAEHVTHGAERGLHQRVRQRERGREQSHGFRRLR